MKEVDPIYNEIRQKQGHLYRLQDEVKKYELLKGQLNLNLLVECLKAILDVDKTPEYDVYEPNGQVKESMKNNKGKLPEFEHSHWLTPRDLAKKLLDLMERPTYEIPDDMLYYRENRD